MAGCPDLTCGFDGIAGLQSSSTRASTRSSPFPRTATTTSNVARVIGIQPRPDSRGAESWQRVVAVGVPHCVRSQHRDHVVFERPQLRVGERVIARWVGEPGAEAAGDPAGGLG